MAVVPKIIKNFNLKVDGIGFAGICEEVKLPDLKIKTDEHRAGGMDSPMAMDMGMDRIEMGFTMVEHSEKIFSQFGLQNQQAVALTFYAAQVDDVNVIPYVIDARGMYTEQRMGSVKNGSMAKLEATVSLRYYKLTLGGNIIHEIDVDNMIRSIYGSDQMQQIREAIGL
jgi:P2 family phage contractile tail tube protein